MMTRSTSAQTTRGSLCTLQVRKLGAQLILDQGLACLSLSLSLAGQSSVVSVSASRTDKQGQKVGQMKPESLGHTLSLHMKSLQALLLGTATWQKKEGEL